MAQDITSSSYSPKISLSLPGEVPPPISTNSTKTPDSKEANVTFESHKPRKSKSSDGKTNSIISTRRKQKAKEDLIVLMLKEGVTFPAAAAQVRAKYGYSRTTPYTWLEDVEGEDEVGNKITYRDRVVTVEEMVFGEFEKAQRIAALGGQLIEETEVEERFASGAIKKKSRTQRWSSPSASAAEKGILRKASRLRRIARHDKEIEKVSLPIPTPEDSKEEPPPFPTKIQIMFEPCNKADWHLYRAVRAAARRTLKLHG